MRTFDSLTEREVCLAIKPGGEDARIYSDFAEGIAAAYRARRRSFGRCGSRRTGIGIG